jgi:lipopolysaccharide/colanic/teichoic acid biosynthesis glycosyltransferase
MTLASESLAAETALEHAFDERPSWPVTRLASWALMLALFACVFLPVSVGRAHGIEWPELLGAAVIVTLVVRALYDALCQTLPQRTVLARALATLAPATVAALGMAAGGAIAGSGSSAARLGGTAALAVLDLSVARAMRQVEIRVRRSLRRVYFVGSESAHRDLERELSRRDDARLVGALIHAEADGVDAAAGRLVSDALAAQATVLVVHENAMHDPELARSIAELQADGVRVRELLDYYEGEFKKVPLSELSPTWFLFESGALRPPGVWRHLRRGFELMFASVALLLSLPFLLIAGIVIRLTSPGPVLYRQLRVGKDGSEFVLLKLRTMAPSADATPAWASSQPGRVTPVGRVLRRFRLDELPQLWNVITGELALVGPRPEQAAIAAQLAEQLPYYSARHHVRPGLTGWAQVTLGPSDSAHGTVAKLQRDLWYIKYSRLRLDALILWLTIKTVFSGRG